VLSREEYVEQAYFFRVLGERMRENMPIQELLSTIRDEVLATTKLPMALDFLLSELRHCGVFHTAMGKLSHYFSPFQTYVISEAEDERGRFDTRIAMEILEKEAIYRSEGSTPQGIFMYQFETLCRNRLSYDKGLKAMSDDPAFDENWRQWILEARRRIGIVDMADMIYVSSGHYLTQQARRGGGLPEPDHPILFGEKEGRIALANRTKDPLLLFGALQRQLGYPVVPRPKPEDDSPHLVGQLMRLMEQFETRLKLLEEEHQQGSIDLRKFYGDRPKNAAN